VDTAERPDDGENLAALLSRLLGKRGISQARLAEETGIPLATLNTWVRGKRTPSGASGATALRALAQHLDATPAEFFEAAGRRAPGPLSEEREEKLLQIYRGLSVQGQRSVIQHAETLASMSRAS
jgi:transcriptional regulator with XRE-family HTH domain